MLLDENNEHLSSFVNMLGQHYDILYTYINEMTKINSREEHPKKLECQMNYYILLQNNLDGN